MKNANHFSNGFEVNKRTMARLWDPPSSRLACGTDLACSIGNISQWHKNTGRYRWSIVEKYFADSNLSNDIAFANGKDFIFKVIGKIPKLVGFWNPPRRGPVSLLGRRIPNEWNMVRNDALEIPDTVYMSNAKCVFFAFKRYFVCHCIILFLKLSPKERMTGYRDAYHMNFDTIT